MNHIYRLVWNASQQAYCAVTETARGRGKASCKVGTAIAASVLAASFSIPAWAIGTNALPTGGQVTAGAAAISSTANALTVNQSSQRAAINWQSFNVGSSASVNFVQPSASSITLNRVVGNERSVIDGAINANGNVWLLNSSGVLFNRSAQVNVGGLVASTLDISDADFMDGRTTFETNGQRGSILNLGTLTAANAGHIALLGQQVANEGVINATLGTAVMAAGDKVTLNFNNNSLVGVAVDRGVLNALVENKNAVIADGGLVTLTAKGLDQVMATVVNNTGEVRAQTIQNREGKIYLLGGMEHDRIEVGGTLDASAPNGGNGGFIDTSAANVQIKDDVRVTTLATNGQTGTWLIDPTDFTIAAGSGAPTSSSIGASTLSTNLGTTHVTLQTVNNAGTDAGDIHVNAAVSWSANTTLTLNAFRNININADITTSGATGKLSLLYGQGATNGVISSTTSTYNIAAGRKVNLQAGQNFDTKLGSTGTTRNWVVITALGSAGDESNAGATNSLQGLAESSRLAGNFVLGADISASGTSTWNSAAGFSPIGFTSNFTGKFDGLGHTITGLTINRPADQYVGLFGRLNAASVSNLTVSGSVTGYRYVGGLAGSASGNAVDQIKNVGSSVAVTAQTTGGTSRYIGGLVGYSNRITILNSYASGNVTDATSGAQYLGGLVGYTDGSGFLTNTYATGNVVGGTGAQYLGGLVGYRYYTDINKSFATGNVSGGSTSNYLGGLIGADYSYTSYSSGNPVQYLTRDVYARGNVSGGNNLGGLIGYSDTTYIQRAYATGQVAFATGATPTANIGGFVGKGYNGVSTPPWLNINQSFWDTQTSGQSSAGTMPSASLAGVTGKTTAEMKAIAPFSGASTPWDIIEDAALTTNYPQLRWATSGASAGSSVWVIGTASSGGVVGGGGATTTQGTSLQNAIAVVLAEDPSPQGVDADALVIGEEPVDRLLPPSFAINEPGQLNPVEGQALPGNVVFVPPGLNLTFGPGSLLALIASPEGDEPSNPVTLSQARTMTGGNAGNGTREVRVPVSRNSLAQIVNGGVRLPGGVEQQLFVVQK